MSRIRRLPSFSSAALLALFTLLALLLFTPAAGAATSSGTGPAVTPASGHPEPMALATTGLDITVPVIIGLTALVLGIAIVAWAFLRPPSAPGQR